VTLQTGTRRNIRWPIASPVAGVIASVLTLSLAVFAAGHAPDKKDKDKAKPESSLAVDSGSFGVFVKGQRVATETFHIEQQSGNSIIKSQVKETGADPTSQKSDLEITSHGELLRYEWSQASGGSLIVSPNNDFLLERIASAGSAKPAEQSFLMPSTSAILDNNFFVHREVLAWRYLSSACTAEGGNLKCQKDPAEFGALVPQDRTSMPVRMELVGKEKVTIRGAERQLLRVNLTGESFEWGLWLDDQDHFKLIRVVISADNTEVVRD
jgi:hypothetical protein